MQWRALVHATVSDDLADSGPGRGVNTVISRVVNGVVGRNSDTVPARFVATQRDAVGACDVLQGAERCDLSQLAVVCGISGIKRDRCRTLIDDRAL
jgi:hypothetical protein